MLWPTISQPDYWSQIIGQLSADRPMPIVKWLIPIIGKLADNRPITIISQ